MARMNTNPFELPRTKIGLGGVRLINVAGATHPETALKARPGMHPKTGKPYGKPPGAVECRAAWRAGSRR